MSLFLSLQVSKIAAYAYSAISQIKVDAKEELVVQFAIPWFSSRGTFCFAPILLSLCHYCNFILKATFDKSVTVLLFIPSTKGFQDKDVAGL